MRENTAFNCASIASSNNALLEFVSALGHTRNNLGECIVCGDGVVKGEHQHSYTFEAIVEATCLTKGEYKAKCFCGENITTSIIKLRMQMREKSEA